MSTYRVLCDACDSEYHITSIVEDLKDPPQTCSFCGSELDITNVVDESDDMDDDEWDKLIEEIEDEFDDDEWKP